VSRAPPHALIHTTHALSPPQRFGEAEAASVRKPSCMPDFNGVSDFASFVGGHASGARGARAGAAAVVAAAAAAALLL
jgi:hypothetical protein